MKIKNGFVLRRVLDEAIVIPSGEASKSFNGMIKLNDTAAFIWEAIAGGKSLPEIAKSLSEEYGISVEKATEDANKMIEKLLTEGFLEK